MNYHEYLQSDDWKHKRDRRVAADGECQICGRPFDLEVHHKTYANVPYENAEDLITLCRSCHAKVEKQKRYAGADSTAIINHMLAKQFCIDNQQLDYSAKGNLDFCNLEVAKRHFYPFLKQHGGDIFRGGVSDVQNYFRDRRYQIILAYMQKGAEPDDIFREYRFSKNMVYKAFYKPEVVANIIKH